jgi:predicted Fe-Mo cluster-binding NifX family protein
METTNRTIAFVTDDGTKISSHFGRAMYYEIITMHDGKIADRRRVSKAGHHSFGGGTHREEGTGPGDDHKHSIMTAPLTSVSVLVARGMGLGAQQHLIASGIEPILTDLHTIDEALESYAAGTLVNNPRRLHDHGTHHH